ncbi:hypothetical protein MYCTH_2129404 [Thermothelomyces thermophilus ATCC 42464]|uniref:Uncharacterized protein n=1 Tax=Thermothelomyces thermophilus (strain ATCC 42464 / BCRC 31852 / DSM 1799) TaxID=573729 RepID=G2QID7_THET4|nr:uncharacterized protein MYCTH_2129404 [Thermothelomyces thermophilus ATCC 42464]AEO60311.1 hypothetical protein MYCTH_2129404 [Thermothelomyces thermophilus ATCC 42464]
MILFELDRLKSSIDEALLASVRPSQGFSHGISSDARVARNLRNLAEAAKQFHSAASSTASTIRDHSGSSIGNFPAYRRERVESFIRSARELAAGSETPPSVEAASPPPDPVVRIPEEVENDEDDEAEFEVLFLNGLEDLARDSIRRTEFQKAIGLLTEAVRRQVILTMLHAVALGCLSTYRFDSALSTCKKVIKAQKRWARATCTVRRTVQGCSETTGLLATIYEMQGDYIAVEIYRPLRDDIPEFSNRSPTASMPGYLGFYGPRGSPDRDDRAQSPGKRNPSLRRNLTAIGGDVSPSPLLRPSRHQWE